MNKLNLCLHCGGHKVDREDLAKVSTPKPEGIWHPIAHTTLLDTVEKSLNKLNMHIVNETFAMANENKRMFGLLQIANGHNSDDHSWVAGIRNSHDKQFPAGLVVGSGVFVCDNLAFSGEIELARKHTTYVMRDLPLLVQKATGELAEKWDIQGRRIEAYKNHGLEDRDAAKILMDCMTNAVFPKTRIDDIWNEWQNPRHPEFKDGNVWSLFNAVTECLKPRKQRNSLFDLPARTTRLHAVCDAASNVDLANLKQAVAVTA